MAPSSLPIWRTPDGWIPEKMRGRGARAATGDGAGRISVAIPAECTGRSFAADARGSGFLGSRPRVVRELGLARRVKRRFDRLTYGPTSRIACIASTRLARAPLARGEVSRPVLTVLR